MKQSSRDSWRNWPMPAPILGDMQKDKFRSGHPITGGSVIAERKACFCLRVFMGSDLICFGLAWTDDAGGTGCS